MTATRHSASFPVENLAGMKQQLLAWAAAVPVAVYLDSNEYPPGQHGTWECLVAVGAADIFQAPSGNAFSGLKSFFEKKQDWLFGFLGYDLKNEIENLRSGNPDGIGLPDVYFFQPETVAGIRARVRSPEAGLSGEDAGYSLDIFSFSGSIGVLYSAIIQTQIPPTPPTPEIPPLIARLPRPDYLKTVEKIRRHIVEGDVYEMNLCQEFYSNPAIIDPRSTFERLNALARAPFAAYFRLHDRYLLCASPERFLRKSGPFLISQPIKGTRRRHPDPLEDKQAREQLRHSEKDRAENVMIVDLVRNDLARHCQPGSVRVDELFGVYSFKTVHQMISTVSGVLRHDAHPIDALRDAFPMGSMTGAPKVMAMELIERYEHTRRGLYSGAVGYFSPDGNFDFNVVIRSILYNAGEQYLSCQVGGAIVYDSVPEEEYDECLVKMAAMRQALGI